jgi:hypothetical protein
VLPALPAGVLHSGFAGLNADDCGRMPLQRARKSTAAAVGIDEQRLVSFQCLVEQFGELDRDGFIDLLEERPGASGRSQGVRTLRRLGNAQLVERPINFGIREQALFDIDEFPRFEAVKSSGLLRTMNANAIAIAVRIR